MKNKTITETYKIGKYKIFFDTKDWIWRAINIFGVGVDSDMNLIELKKRIRKLAKQI